ncbi:MAG: GntR family transcriptional regulator [Brachymonas sp.]
MMPVAQLIQLPPPDPGQRRYALLAQGLRGRVLSGEWAAGVALPAEQELSRQYEVALGTMRQALQMLVQEGLIERIHGRGTFVKQALTGAPMMRFFRFGQTESQPPQSRILQRSVCNAPAQVAQSLGLAPAHPVLRLERLRLIANKPCLLEEIWLPLPSFSALADSEPAGWGDLLYPAYADLCGVLIHRASDTISFGQLGAAQAQQLALPAAHPCAIVQRLAFDWAGRCVEVRSSRGDAFAFNYSVNIT